mgnify:CR=1 FL=1
MINRLQKKYALSVQGAKDLLKQLFILYWQISV